MIAKPHRRSNIAFPLGDVLKHMAVHEWGDVKNPEIVICVHGLSRTGRDFDPLAEALSKRYRVLCPDIPGRGESDWLSSAEQYVAPVYIGAIQAMLLQLGVQRYHWVGTSMGGIIGMVMASLPDTPLRRFVINDVGPTIERVALDRIGTYVGRAPLFPDYLSLFNAVLPSLQSFGPLEDEQLHHMVRTTSQQRPDGQWEMVMDPKIGDAFRTALTQPEVDLWPFWRAIKAPTLILRGAQSDLLSQATVERMLATHPSARAVDLANTGHAPMIMDAPTITLVQDFLAEP